MPRQRGAGLTSNSLACGRGLLRSLSRRETPTRNALELSWRRQSRRLANRARTRQTVRREPVMNCFCSLHPAGGWVTISALPVTLTRDQEKARQRGDTAGLGARGGGPSGFGKSEQYMELYSRPNFR